MRVQVIELRVQVHEFKFTSYDFNFTSYVFKSTSYEFKFKSCEFKSKSSRIISSMKTEVNSLKISPFLKILSLQKVKFLQIKQDAIKTKMLPNTWKKIVQVRMYTLNMTRPPLIPSWLDDPPFPHQLCTYLIDGPFLSQKIYKDIRISYSLKYKHSKKKFLYKKVSCSVGWNKHSGEQY